MFTTDSVHAAACDRYSCGDSRIGRHRQPGKRSSLFRPHIRLRIPRRDLPIWPSPADKNTNN